MLAVAVALAAAVAPLPSAWVERVYSRGLYPRIQSIVTPVSALTSIALLDVAVAILLTTALALLVRRVRTHGPRAAFIRAIAAVTVPAASALRGIRGCSLHAPRSNVSMGWSKEPKLPRRMT